MFQRLLTTYLTRSGWRVGRDGLWRNDSYGGSWKTRNAVKQQWQRPVRRYNRAA